MNIIRTSLKDAEYICAICQETFLETDQISLIKHFNEDTDQARHRRHLFHSACLGQQMTITHDGRLLNYEGNDQVESREGCEFDHSEDFINHDDDSDDSDDDDDDDASEHDHLCPLDREPISDLFLVKYTECLTKNKSLIGSRSKGHK